ncbi:MAG: adenylate/guanylate cyclase domain-containing protein [Chloroflexi bacterium]|nr:adenylate/guanylate cyclase domain-containing protein [Chloroflexota bacterium]
MEPPGQAGVGPRIQYAKTKDGVNIAYWTMGEGGTPLLMTPPLSWSHVALELQIPELLDWYQRLAARRMIVRWDGRGYGMSDRGIAEFSLEISERDVEAVLGALGLDRVDFAGFFGPGGAAVRFAARNPQRVSRLVLWSVDPRPGEFFRSPRGEWLLSLIDQDWEMFTETIAQLQLDWRGGRRAHEWAMFIRQSITPEDQRRVFEGVAKMDFTPLLSKITAKTLVLTGGRDATARERAKEFTTKIRNARLALMDERAGVPWEISSGMEAMEGFLSEGGDAPAAASLPEGTAIILFLDIADSTALTTKLGDAAYREKEHELDTALRAAITEAGGTPVEGKVLGDGVMAVFTSARQAIDAAQRCRDLGNEAGLPLHLGIHAGDVVREGNNVHGGAVQVAARVQSVAAPGEILVSATVRDLARTSAGVAFEDRGEHELKGIDEPQRLFAVGTEEQGTGNEEQG